MSDISCQHFYKIQKYSYMPAEIYCSKCGQYFTNEELVSKLNSFEKSMDLVK